MPFEGSAIARAVSAEYIAASRARSRSASSGVVTPGLPLTPRTASGLRPDLYVVSPAPIYATSRFDDEHRKKKSPTGPVSPGLRPGRNISGYFGQNAAIPEEAAAEAVAEADRRQTAAAGSDHTLTEEEIEERDVERGDTVTGPLKARNAVFTRYESRKAEKAKELKDKEKNKEGGDNQAPQQEQQNDQQQQDEKDPFLITLEGREHLNPHTWNRKYRWFLTGLAGLFVLNATFASSAPSQLEGRLVEYFGFSEEVATLCISLFVAGYCVGPLLWGPLSERYGRKLVFIVAFVPYIGFQVGCALSKNTASILVFRFLGGCFAASPLTNSGGLIADLWDADTRGVAMSIFSIAPFAGPAVAPIVAGALEVTNTDWRWIFWILTIFAGVCLVLIVFVMPETYVPYKLHKEAKRIRKETGESRYHSTSEHPDHETTLWETLHDTVLKPFIMIVQEPMLLILTLYLSFVYGIVYLLFGALPIIFQQNRGWNSLEAGLVFLGIPVGGFFAVLLNAFYFNKVYVKKHHQMKGKMVPPEERLKPLMLAAPCLAIAFFWLGWTYYPSISAASPIIAICLMGFAILFIFLGVFNYLIDSYLMNAASALAINTVVRSAFGAGFPLFTRQMYSKLGVPGACSLLAGLAIVFLPAPFVLYKYGKKIRELSKNAMVFD